MRRFPILRQLESRDCGPTCLRMILRHYGREYSINTLRQYCEVNKNGVNLLGIKAAAEKLGLDTLAARMSFDDVKQQPALPFIVHWKKNHFVVVYKIKHNSIYIADPNLGRVKMSQQLFLEHWLSGQETGIVLYLVPGDEQAQVPEEAVTRGNRLLDMFSYLRSQRSLILQLLLGLFLSAGFEILMPFLSKEIIDTGVKAKDMDFIVLILLSQVTILVAKSVVEFIRSWMLLYISSRVNLTILISFVIKFLKLPLSFVEVRKPGDILQRINDHGRIENFITSNTFTTIFSLFNLLALGILLSYFNFRIFFVFALSSIIYFCWITIFLKKRRLIDKSRFEVTSATQSKVVQLIDGFQEIKISNSDEVKRWEWESLMAREFRVRVKSLTLTQYQQTGSLIITEGRNLLITFMGAAMVIKGELSIGTLFAVQFIVGQLIAPVESLIAFFQAMQDAKMSLERLQEINEMEDEEPETAGVKQQVSVLPGDIRVKDLSFRYPGTGSAFVLQNLNLIIPKGKVTAIVGLSGSGKTTLLKLLLKLHAPSKGIILAGDCSIGEISNYSWRNICGTVLQDGFIFSDTIARNIALGSDSIDDDRMQQAIRCANIEEFIHALPLGLETEIGNGAKGISQGQKQRILIARAVYKDPQILLFDEATNALDANNEQTIMHNLQQFFNNKTVVIVAHRLSTVRDADKIIVMENGRIVEEGSHTQLLYNNAAYSRLIKNQTETLSYEQRYT